MSETTLPPPLTTLPPTQAELPCDDGVPVETARHATYYWQEWIIGRNGRGTGCAGHGSGCIRDRPLGFPIG